MVNVWQWVKGKIQPVTASLSLLMLYAYVGSTHLDRFLQPQISLAWRAFLSVFYHKSGLHLFLNIMWTFNIGSNFEKAHGSWSFLGTTTLMIFLSQGLTLLIYLPYVLFRIQCLHLEMPSLQLNAHTLGFSGVLFALHFLLVRSSPCYLTTEGLLLSGDHNGLLIEGLFFVASLQTLILPDSYFINNLSGIIAGIVHISIPHISKILVVCGMLIYIRGIHPMYHNVYNIFQKFSVKAKRYYCHLFHQFNQGSRRLSTSYNADDDHQILDQEDEEDDEGMDPILQWECKTCLRKNGVFLQFCEFCKEWRTVD